MARELVVMRFERTRPATFRSGSCMPAHKVEIVFITIAIRVAIRTPALVPIRFVPGRTKSSLVLPARRPAAVTYGQYLPTQNKLFSMNHITTFHENLIALYIDSFSQLVEEFN